MSECASSVTLSSVQSLCDTLAHLPLPSSVSVNRIARITNNNNNLQWDRDSLGKMRSALIAARAETDQLTFTTPVTGRFTECSPLIRELSSVFGGHVNHSDVTTNHHNNMNNDNHVNDESVVHNNHMTTTAIVNDKDEDIDDGDDDDESHDSVVHHHRTHRPHPPPVSSPQHHVTIEEEFESMCEATDGIEIEQLKRMLLLCMKLKRNGQLSSCVKLTQLQATVGQQLSVWSARIDAHYDHCMDLSLIGLTVMTSPDVTVHEECLEAIVAFLSQTVTAVKGKKKRNRLSEIVSLVTLLCELRRLNDSIVLTLTRASIAAFFSEDNDQQLQLHALQLIAIIFKLYEKHRTCILEELLNCLGRTQKRNSYDSQITMYTALIMTLTHALFESRQESSYDAALHVTSAFLSSFMRKSQQNDKENDFRAVFDQFVSDVSRALHRPQWPAAQLLLHVLIKLFVSHLSPKSKSHVQMRVACIDHLATVCSRLAPDIAARDTLEQELTVTLKDMTMDESDDENVDDLKRIAWKHLMRYMIAEKLTAERATTVAIYSRELTKQQPDSSAENFYTEPKQSSHATANNEHIVDSATAATIVKYFDIHVHATTMRLFDVSIAHITASLSLSTQQRSRAMRALSVVLSASPTSLATSLLARADLQMAMRSALLDASTSVREATIELIGRFMLMGDDESLLDKYCDVIADRVLDCGVSVRKRVIRIIRDICVAHPRYGRVGELLARALRRINDDGEGIRKLVAETFGGLWFQSIDVDSMLTVVGVVMATNQSVEPMSLLLDHVLGKSPSAESIRVSKQIVSAVVERLVQQSPDDRCSAVAAMTTLWLFARAHPPLLTDHVNTLQPFLSLPCQSQLDAMLRVRTLATIECAIVHVRDPSEALLARVEEDLTKNVLQSPALVLPQCVSCLSAVIHTHTHNNVLVTDLFNRFTTLLSQTQTVAKSRLLRALLSCGLLAKHFDLDTHTLTRQLHALIDTHHDTDPDITEKALTALGFVCHRKPVTFLNSRDLLSRILAAHKTAPQYTTCLLNALRGYLSESTTHVPISLDEWTMMSLKDASQDETSTLQSTVVQHYLMPILDCTLSSSVNVRRSSVSLVHVIHSAGHVHPLSLVPHLVAMTSDDDTSIRTRADHVLTEIERKYTGFVMMKARAAIAITHDFAHNTNSRGYRIVASDGTVVARLSSLYSIVARNRQSRRGLLQVLLRHVEKCDNDDDGRVRGFVAENFPFLPMTVADEPLFVLHTLDTTVSVLASHTHALFKDVLGITDDDDEQQTPVADEQRTDETRVPQLLESLRHVYLVTWLRQLMRELYSLSDAKCGEYSPHESAKVWDKPIHRKQFDARHLEQLMVIPEPSRDLNAAEYERFKSTTLSGFDPNSPLPSAILQQKLPQQTPQQQQQNNHLIQTKSCFVRLEQLDLSNVGKRRRNTHDDDDD